MATLNFSTSTILFENINFNFIFRIMKQQKGNYHGWLSLHSWANWTNSNLSLRDQLCNDNRTGIY